MKHLARIAAAATLAAGGAALSVAPASAQPLVTGGLVNVTVTNVANNNEILNQNNISVGAALQIAANVCDVNVLAVQLGGDSATCTNEQGTQRVDITQTQ